MLFHIYNKLLINKLINLLVYYIIKYAHFHLNGLKMFQHNMEKNQCNNFSQKCNKYLCI